MDSSSKKIEYSTKIETNSGWFAEPAGHNFGFSNKDIREKFSGKASFKMDLLLQAMLYIFEVETQKKNLELIIDYDKKIPETLIGDPICLQKIILNLFCNALKHTKKGSIAVSVKLLNDDVDKATIEFSILDTRVEIQGVKIKNTFKNFQYESGGNPKLYNGTELDNLKQLVELQGGSLTLKSKIGEGSTFSFVLNLDKTDYSFENIKNILELNPQNKNIKVLIVGKMISNQFFNKTILDEFRFEYEIVEKDKIDVEKINSKYFDIILIDMRDLVANGHKSDESIKEISNYNIPVIALVDDGTPLDLQKCGSLRINYYIAKTVDKYALYAKIIDLVKKSKKINLNKPKLKLSALVNAIKYVDLEYLKRRTKSNPKIMMDMISIFLSQTPCLIETMKKSLRDKEFPLLNASMHKIIPSFSIMGISPDFENMAKKMQDYKGEKHLEEAVEKMATNLEYACEHACKELEIELTLIKNNYP